MFSPQHPAILQWSIRFLFSVLGFTISLVELPTIAQIIPDDSLGTERSDLSPANVINGGARRGGNLFHSFSEFNIGNGQRIDFANPVGVDRILTRVTGSNRSNILGTLGVLGNADFFLINPNGIIFGPNAQLDGQGSFIASTANSVVFSDGFTFSAVNPQTPPLLTINLPIGLQVGADPGALINQSRATDATGKVVGLQVPAGKTIALVGGDISLLGGYLTAVAGRAELGSIAAGEVRLTSIPSGWQLSYPDKQSWRDIQMTQASRVTIAGDGGSGIQAQARRISLTAGSQLDANVIGSLPGGTLTVNAAESILLSGQTPDLTGPSGLIARTGGTGKAGAINISTKQLQVNDRATISTATYGAGDSGNITIRATNSVEVIGSDETIASSISTDSQPDSTGNAGNLKIDTRRLTVREGGQVSTASFGSGNGGTLIINATDSVDVSGVNPTDTFSSVIASQSDFTSTGFSGDLRITTGTLTIRDGAFVSAANRGLGRGGNLDIQATRSVIISGVSPIVDYPTYLQIDGLGRGGAGDLRITTPFLQVSDGAIVTASSIFGEGGNIIINAGTILLRRQGQIIGDADPSANAFPRPDITIPSTANGGNVIINADNLLLAEKSSITANAVQGQGGNVRIRTQSFFLLSESQITASSEFGLAGNVTITTLGIDPLQRGADLPTTFSSPPLAQGCRAQGNRASSFVIAGQGGVPTNPIDPIAADTLWQDLQPLPTSENQKVELDRQPKSAIAASPASLVEVQNLILLPSGTAVLTAQAAVPPYGTSISISTLCPSASP
ncbi:filamentous hemagglutinin N-terminal domain-containing protein [Pantanalinema rosaneae CENA516]|uniref:two-partner secretion domain-containing protein n=1 Tax=Pantanalinema rosaneae TaxID=1620701 RepID=UPI003D6FF124